MISKIINSKTLFTVRQQYTWCPYGLRIRTNTFKVQKASHAAWLIVKVSCENSKTDLQEYHRLRYHDLNDLDLRGFVSFWQFFIN